MSEVEKTCENCEYEHEDIEGTHCRHCIHNAIECFKQKEINYTEQGIRNKAIDEFAEMVEIEILTMLTSEQEYRIAKKSLNEIAEQMKGGE